jgi:hypothetical protein
MSQTDDLRPPTPERPRLFISYRWGDAELESWLDGMQLMGTGVPKPYG